jgi:hypothetical protein
MEGTDRGSRGDGRIGRIGRLQRLGIETANDGVQMWVDRVDAGEMGLDDLATRHVPGCDHPSQFECAELPEFAHRPIMSQP